MEEKVGTEWVDYRASDYIPPHVQSGFWERMRMVAALVKTVRGPFEGLVDIGCNGGHLLQLVGKPCWGYDIAVSPLAVARQAGHDAREADIMTDDLEMAPVVTICEVLEHLDDPHAMVRRLDVDPVRCVIASGPYLETAHDHYEQHIWAWDEDGFAQMFRDAGFTIGTQATANVFQALVAYRGDP
jgi:hypothetical protein